jgi:hypothetical protein
MANLTLQRSMLPVYGALHLIPTLVLRRQLRSGPIENAGKGSTGHNEKLLLPRYLRRHLSMQVSYLAFEVLADQ